MNEQINKQWALELQIMKSSIWAASASLFCQVELWNWRAWAMKEQAAVGGWCSDPAPAPGISHYANTHSGVGLPGPGSLLIASFGEK